MSLQQQIKEACEQLEGVTFRSSYCGRGMYNRRCIGIVGSLRACQQVLSVVCQQLADHVFDETARDVELGVAALVNAGNEFDRLMQYTQDKIGWDVIMYWESLQPEETGDI